CVLQVPFSLGRLQQSGPNDARITRVQQGDGAEALHQITWLEPPIGEKFYLSFEHDIRPETVLRGTLVLEFEGTLSGAHSPLYFNPVGQKPAARPKGHISTLVEVRFDLSMASLLFQEEISLSEIVAQPGISPNYQFIMALTNRLSQQGYYFKQVRE